MMTPIQRSLRTALLLSALLALVPTSAPAAEIALYRPTHRSPTELTELAEALLGENGAAIADRGSGTLILRGSQKALARTLDTLRRLDLPPRSYRIETRLTSEAALRLEDVSVEGWLQAGDLEIARAEVSEAGFGVIFRSLGSEEASEVLTTLSVLEGHDAEIWTGTVLPAEVTLHRDSDRGIRKLEVTPTVSVRSGVRLRPRRLGDGWVELEIAPVIEEPMPGGAHRQTGAATRIKLQPGQGVVIASATGIGNRVVSTPLVSHRLESQSRETLLWVRISSEDPEPLPPRAGPR
jgi:hypothetical protein